MIAPGQVAIVDGGTTSALLVSQLPADLRATIVTHSPSVAVALAAHPSIDVILIGGRLYKHSIVAVGGAAMEGIARIHADLYFMGVTGVHPVAGQHRRFRAAIKRALAERAARRSRRVVEAARGVAVRDRRSRWRIPSVVGNRRRADEADRGGRGDGRVRSGEGLRSRECAGCVDALMLDVLMYRADG